MRNTYQVIGNEVYIEVFLKGKVCVAVVDVSDLLLVSTVSKWYAASGKKRIVVQHVSNGTTVRLHNLILGRKPDCVVVHVDGNGLNNRRSNLEHRPKHQVFKRPAVSKHWRSTRAVARRRMEEHLGRKLVRNEHVHHINGDYTDNRLENLTVLEAGDHAKHHNPRNPIPRRQRPCNLEETSCAICCGTFKQWRHAKRKIQTCSRACASILMSRSQAGRVFIRQPQANSSTGIRGVSYHKRLKSKPYSAHLRDRHLGYFATAEEAARVIDDAVNTLRR